MARSRSTNAALSGLQSAASVNPAPNMGSMDPEFDNTGAYIGPDWGALARAARASNANGTPESLINPGGMAAEAFDTVMDAAKMSAAAHGLQSVVNPANLRVGPSQGFNAALLRQESQRPSWLSQGKGKF